jgi:hypothetical protein
MKNFLSVFERLNLFILLNILFVDCNIFSQTIISRELKGFRGSDWGSSINKVKEAEKEDYLQSFHGFGIDALSYSGGIAGLNARIDYSFKDNKLFEGTYTINPEDDIKFGFNKLERYLIGEYGKPNFRAGKSINSDSIWINVNDYGKFSGPELFWKFDNGFVGLIASKFENDITITVLYSNDKSIEEYGSDRLISTGDYR